MASTALAASQPQTGEMPLSANSPATLKLLNEAWVLDSDHGQQAAAIQTMRKLVKQDPNFAMGHEILSQISLNPAEQVREQQKAWDNRGHANPAEQTVIDWFQNAADHKLIPAIMNMNEALRAYPHDRWLVFLANSWLMAQTQYERASEVFENSGLSDSPGLINNEAYTCAHMRQFSKAFRLMDRYVAMMPHDPNPEDSYAEILRMAGHYNAAISHYRAALAIDSQFYTSQFGIADTYLLMGDETRARQEYEKAFQKFTSLPTLDMVLFRTREATTYLYEGDTAAADKAFQALADDLHSKQLSRVEADVYRQMAMYQTDPEHAFQLLRTAELALAQRSGVSALAFHQELAQILRARVEAGIRFEKPEMADSGLAKLTELSQTAEDKVIDSEYHGAVGARLFQQRRYKEAIPHLEEDSDNPLSLERLIAAYERTGYTSGARETERVLANLNDPTVEQAMVVPAFRKCLENATCKLTVRNASFIK
jgi:tetratricopeptide (TPR) repeat protein